MISVHTSPLDQPGTGDGGGLNVYVRQIAAGLARRGIEVDVYTRRSAAEESATTVLDDGVTVHRIEAGPLRPVDKNTVANLLCAFVLALRQHPTIASHDVLHTHYWLSGWVGRRIAEHTGVPFVHTFHTLGLVKNASLAPGDTPESPLRLAAEESIARDADQVLVLTCDEARLLHEAYGVGGQRLTVVRAGVDLKRFHPDPEGPSTPFSSGAGAPRLLFVGRLQALKGPDLAVRILAHVCQVYPDAQLEIVGGPSGPTGRATEPSSLLALAAELGVADNVRLVPAMPQQDLAVRYRSSDVVLVPSRSETFGLVALEAQASGVPVVAARVGGLRAVVADPDGLVIGHDPVEHAEAVLRVLSDPALAARMRRAGIARAQSSSWESTVDRLVEAYRRVVRPVRATQVSL